MEAFLVDQWMDDFKDVIAKVYKPAMNSDEASKAEQIAEIFDTIAPNFLAKLEERCAAGEFLVGKTLTIADFYVGGGFYTNYCANPSIGYCKDRWA